MINYPTKKLGEVCDILDNLRKPVTARDRVPGSFPYYGATGIQDYVDKYIFDEDLVLVGEDGARWNSGDNTAFAISGKTWVNNHAHVIRPHRDILIDRWLIYFLNISDLSEYITGTTVKKLNQEKLRSIPIPLPPLAAQQKIVARLDELLGNIAEAKRLRQEAIADTEKILSQTLREIFEEGKEKGWEEISFGNKEYINIIDGDRGKNYPTKSEFTPEGYCLFLNTSNVRKGEFDFSRMDFITKEKDESLRKGKISRGDIILTTRGTLGNSAFYDENIPFENVRINSGMVILRLDQNKILPKYLVNIINSNEFINKVQDANSGSAQPQLPIKVLSTLTFLLPPLPEQHQIVTRLDTLSAKLRELRQLQAEQLEDLKKLEKAYLREAFSGELIY